MASLAQQSPRPAGGKLERVAVWFRRDLRVEDNPALVAALQLGMEVIPVFIYAPEEEGQFQPGRCSRWWLHKSLIALERDLVALGSRLLFYRAIDSRVALAQLVEDLGVQAVVFNHLYDPMSMVSPGVGVRMCV
jgi:cryptochrome 1